MPVDTAGDHCTRSVVDERSDKRVTLFEINEAIRNFDYEWDEETGELLNADELTALEIAKDEKREAIACVIKEHQALLDALKKEKKSISDRIVKEEKKVENLTKWLGFELGYKPFATAKTQVAWRRSETTDIVDVRLLPEEYVTTKVTEETVPDKKKIKDAIKSGKEIPGAMVTEHYNIKIS